MSPALAAALLAASAWAAVPSTMTVVVDPRIELLGVVQVLAGVPRIGLEVPAELEWVKAGFSSRSGHPAVRRYARIAARPKGEHSLGVLALCLTPPPALAWRLPAEKVPWEFAEMAGGRLEVEAFLAELRDFARVSGFARRLARREPEHARRREEVLRALAGTDPMAAADAYFGPLDSRLTVILSGLWRSGSLAYVLPYPYHGPKVHVAGPFEVFTVAEPIAVSGGRPVFEPGSFWHDLLSVAVDPILSGHCEEVESLSGLWEGVKDRCPPPWPRCLTSLINAAAADRLSRAGPFAPANWSATPYGDCGRALTRSLAHYEEDRGRYPALRDYYPRLLAALRELPAARRGPRPAPEPGWACRPAEAGPGAVPALEPGRGRPLGASELVRRGVWRFGRGEVKEALWDFDEAASLEPGDAETQLDRSAALQRLGRPQEALDAAERAVAIARRSDASGALIAETLSNRATLWEASGRKDRAHRDLEEALKAAPADWLRRDEAKKRLEGLR